MYSSARNDHRQPECMNQVLVITMCARAIGGPLKLKKRNCILCAQSQEPPPRVSPETFSHFIWLGFFLLPLIDRELLVRLFSSHADNGPHAAQS